MLFNELASGVSFNASPELTAAFELSPLLAAGVTLVAIQLLGVALEVPLLALSQRWPRRPMIAGGLLVMALSCLLAAWAPSYSWLIVALALYGPAAGIGVGVSEAALVDGEPQRAEAVLARWTLLGSVGDIGTPALLALVIACGFTWRAAFGVAGLLVLLNAWAVWRGPEPARRAHDDEAERGTLKDALKNRRLVLWELACVFCAFLDELMVGFGALHLRMPPADRAIVFTAWMLGAIAGSVVTERMLARRSGKQVLIAASLLCVPALAVWLAATSVWLSALSLAALGACAAPMYPLARAQSYGAMPGASGAVTALGALLQPVEMAFPLAVGLAANAFGVDAALTLLFLQPAALLALAVFSWRRGA